jgi:hypothetical protein
VAAMWSIELLAALAWKAPRGRMQNGWTVGVCIRIGRPAGEGNCLRADSSVGREHSHRTIKEEFYAIASPKIYPAMEELRKDADQRGGWHDQRHRHCGKCTLWQDANAGCTDETKSPSWRNNRITSSSFSSDSWPKSARRQFTPAVLNLPDGLAHKKQ